MGKAKLPAAPSSAAEVADFVTRIRATKPRADGRLLFAIDATASREPTWDLACQLQADMFAATAGLGGLAIQLCFYRGFGEFMATPWLASAPELIRRMVGVRCRAGRTQIARVLEHALAETRARKVSAVVFVGDVVEEAVDALGHAAGELGLLKTPVFVFQEGQDATSRRAFQQIAQLSGGAYCHFDQGSADQLRQLLTAVAIFSAGGQKALEDYGRRTGGHALLLTDQMGGRR